MTLPQPKSESPQIDVLEIMDSIRERIREMNKGPRDPKVPFPSSTISPSAATHKAGELAHSEDLRYLNIHYAFSTDAKLENIQSHRGGILGRFVVKVKRKVRHYIWNALLRDYFIQERDYFSNLVRHLNATSKYIDARDTTLFLDLVRKIDVDIQQANERIERARDEAHSGMRGAEERLMEIIESLDRKVQMVDRVARGLEGIIHSLKSGALNALAPVASQSQTTPLPDLSYLLLEHRYRGSEEAIAERLSIYPPLFAKAKAPVLEIGPGRGELQHLLKAASVKSYGVDLDEAMVKVAIEQGHDVRLGDALSHLQSLPDRSLGGVVGIQVVEHLSSSALRTLFALIKQKVIPGGVVVFETIDPRSLIALSSNYFRDPTHVWPQHPDTLSYSMTLSGLAIREIRSLSPFPASSRLQRIEPPGTMSPEVAGSLQVVHRNFEKIDALLFGYQDYCVIAEA